MRIIDILVSKANGTLEDGFAFKYKNQTFKYDKVLDGFYSGKGLRFRNVYVLDSFLTDEVEVIEQNKDIEELKMKDEEGGITVRCPSNIEMFNKLNEIIKEVNKLKNK